MDNKDFYNDIQLNKIYRITEEGSEEEYEAETELHKDLLAIRLAEKDPLKFKKYFKNANRNDVLNDAYNMSAKDKINLMITHGDLFKYNNNFEKEIIDRLMKVIKKSGFLSFVDSKKFNSGDPNELGKLIGNEINAILVSDAVCAELRNRYNLDFKLFTNSALDKKAYVNNTLKIEDYIRAFNSAKSLKLGAYKDQNNSISINTTIHNKANLNDNITCQQALLKTLYHEVRHAVMFDRIKHGNFSKEEYLIAKNYLYINNNPAVYKFKHDYFECEIDAIDFAEKKVKEEYKNTNIKIFSREDITLNRNTKSYDEINNITLGSQDPILNALATLEKLNLDDTVKILYENQTLTYDLKCYIVKMCIKNCKFYNNFKLNKDELNFLKKILIDIKKENSFIMSHIPNKDYDINKGYFTVENDKLNKVLKKI